MWITPKESLISYSLISSILTSGVVVFQEEQINRWNHDPFPQHYFCNGPLWLPVLPRTAATWRAQQIYSRFCRRTNKHKSNQNQYTPGGVFWDFWLYSNLMKTPHTLCIIALRYRLVGHLCWFNEHTESGPEKWHWVTVVRTAPNDIIAALQYMYL